MGKAVSDRTEWVSLGEAAEILGVHPSTVRHWADSGELPSHRTPGGHRRFRRRDLDQWASARGREMAPAEAQLVLQSTLGRTRLELSSGQMKGLPWYERFDEQARAAHRALGRHLLEILTDYLVSPADTEGQLEEVRRLGAEYAQLSYKQGISMTDSVRAFLFFRDLVIDSVIQLAETLGLHTPLDWGARLQQVNRMTDSLLLAMIKEYEEICGQAKT